MVLERSSQTRPTSLFLVISIFVFLSMVASAGGLYFYKTTVAKNITAMEKNLTIAKDRFEPSKITQLKVLDQRLKASNEILAKHIAISPIFSALSDVTMKSIRYTKFSYDVGTSKEARVTVNLSGQASRYSSVALQADLFAKNKNIIDPVFSNLSLDEKGNVLFDLQFSVDPRFVSYAATIEDTAAQSEEGTTPTQSEVQSTATPATNGSSTNPFLNQ